MCRWLILFFAVMLCSPSAYAKNKKQDTNLKENGEKYKIFIQMPKLTNLNEEYSASYSAKLAGAFRELGLYEVVTTDDLSNIVDYENLKDVMACNNVSCMADLGGVAIADYMVNCNITKFPDNYSLALTISDVNSLKQINTITEDVSGISTSPVNQLLPLMVKKMFKNTLAKKEQKELDVKINAIKADAELEWAAQKKTFAKLAKQKQKEEARAAKETKAAKAKTDEGPKQNNLPPTIDSNPITVTPSQNDTPTPSTEPVRDEVPVDDTPIPSTEPVRDEVPVDDTPIPGTETVQDEVSVTAEQENADSSTDRLNIRQKISKTFNENIPRVKAGINQALNTIKDAFNNNNQKTAAKLGATFTDPRDGRSYKTAEIGNKIWMIQNLQYERLTHFSVKNDPAMDEQYGYLYKWGDARLACPDQWRLPTAEDYHQLFSITDSRNNTSSLRAAEWENGNNDTLWEARPAGYRCYDRYFNLVGAAAYFWTASPKGYERALGAYVYPDRAGIMQSFHQNAFSVRCVKDIY